MDPKVSERKAVQPDGRRPYVAPAVHSTASLERTALACQVGFGADVEPDPGCKDNTPPGSS